MPNVLISYVFISSSVFNTIVLTKTRQKINIKCFLGNLNLNFDIIAISETWLCDGKVQDINIPGYEVTHHLRLNKKGGGCSIFVKEDCKFKVLK